MRVRDAQRVGTDLHRKPSIRQPDRATKRLTTERERFSLASVFEPRRVASAIGLLLSVLLAFSLWTVFGLVTDTLSAPTGPELTRGDPTEEGQARLVAEVELKEEDNEGSDHPLSAADVCVNRDLLAFAPSLGRRAWCAEVRSMVSRRVREGHGARGPPQA
jgi:hypothetical protein